MSDTFTLPVIPMKNTALLPHLMMPLSVGRSRSVAAVDAALATEDKEIAVISQRDSNVENPDQAGLYSYGTKAVIRKMSRPGEQHIDVLVLGTERIKLLNIEQAEPYLIGRFEAAPVKADVTPEVEALRRSVVDIAQKAFELAEASVPAEFGQLAQGDTEPMRLAHLLASMLDRKSVV